MAVARPSGLDSPVGQNAKQSSETNSQINVRNGEFRAQEEESGQSPA